VPGSAHRWLGRSRSNGLLPYTDTSNHGVMRGGWRSVNRGAGRSCCYSKEERRSTSLLAMRQHHNLRCARSRGIELNEVERLSFAVSWGPADLAVDLSSILTGFNIWTESLKLQYVPTVRMVYQVHVLPFWKSPLCSRDWVVPVACSMSRTFEASKL